MKKTISRDIIPFLSSSLTFLLFLFIFCICYPPFHLASPPPFVFASTTTTTTKKERQKRRKRVNPRKRFSHIFIALPGDDLNHFTWQNGAEERDAEIGIIGEGTSVELETVM